MLKIINTILSIILLILSCLPCADTEMNSYAHTADKFESNHNNHSHDKQNDLCPPFCSCNCCGMQILNFSQEITFAFRKVSIEIPTQIPTYKSPIDSNFYGSIWQPPQIV